MTRYLLDTNIISNATRPAPAASLMAWLADQHDGDLFIAAFTVAEVWRGVLATPAGRKRDELERWFAGPEGPRRLFAGRVLPFEENAALIWGRLMATSATMGRPRSGLDTIIASVAEANGCVVVTDNESDFEGVDIFNPMRGAT